MGVHYSCLHVLCGSAKDLQPYPLRCFAGVVVRVSGIWVAFKGYLILVCPNQELCPLSRHSACWTALKGLPLVNELGVSLCLKQLSLRLSLDETAG